MILWYAVERWSSTARREPVPQDERVSLYYDGSECIALTVNWPYTMHPSQWIDLVDLIPERLYARFSCWLLENRGRPPTDGA